MRKILLAILLSPLLCFAQWTKQTSGTTEVLNNVYFVDDNIGYAVGNNGAMIRTTSGGAKWSSVNTSISSGQLLGVHFVDGATGWICGTDGVLKKTSDSGKTWKTYNTGFSTYLSGIYFTSKRVGYTAGQNGKVMKTTDSGKTWSSQNVGTINYINMYFRDSLNGYACGGFSTVIHTKDGGVKWDTLTTMLSQYPLYSVKFITDKIGFAVGLNGMIIKTVNGGSTWVKQNSGHTKSLYSVHFNDTLNGWVACNQADSILTTTDGGKNWVSSSLKYANGYTCVFFPSKNTGYIVGQNGAVFKLNNNSGIDKIGLARDHFAVYPNPATGIVNISSGDEIEKYSVYDMGGKLICSGKFDNARSSFSIDVSRYSNGVYIVELSCNGILRREKMVVSN